MAIPSVKGYMPLCMTPRSKVCDEQGVGQWPIWKRYDSIKSIVTQYVDEQYRDFLALPYYEIDKLKAEEIFYWYTPRSETSYVRLNRTGDDHDYYKSILDNTLEHYRSVVSKLQNNDKTEESNFLQLSLSFIGESEDNIYCGDNHVIATVWGMRPRKMNNTGGPAIFTPLEAEPPMHTVQFDLGKFGTTENALTLNKRHGRRIAKGQIPLVKVNEGYEFTSWDINPIDVEVTGDMLFTAQYRELPKAEKQKNYPPKEEQNKNDSNLVGKPVNTGSKEETSKVAGKTEEGQTEEGFDKKQEKILYTVRFLKPDKSVISQYQVEEGSRLSSAQIPPLPYVNGIPCPGWENNPLGEIINSDHDYIAKQPHTSDNNDNTHRSWFWKGGKRQGFWRWILRISLFILSAFLVLYIIYLCNPCSK